MSTHLCVRRRQALANVNPEERVSPQRDVELEELWLRKMQQRPPEDAGGHLLGHPLAHLQVAGVDAAILNWPGAWKRQGGAF